MPSIRISQDLPATPQQVWADVSVLASHVEWMADAESIHFLTDQQRGIGTVFDCVTKVGPIQLTDRMTVTRWDEVASIGVRHEGVVTGEGVFLLDELLSGQTRFTWAEQLYFPWYLAGPLGAFVAQPVLRAIWKKNLQRLAARYEG